MRLRILKALLSLVCASHLVLGMAGVLSPVYAVDMARLFYGAELEATPVVAHLLRIIGAYMIAIGILAGMAVRDPERHRPFILAAAALLGIRVLQRILHADEIQTTFGVSTARIWLQSGFFFLLAGALLYLRPSKTE